MLPQFCLFFLIQGTLIHCSMAILPISQHKTNTGLIQFGPERHQIHPHGVGLSTKLARKLLKGKQ